MSQSGRPVSGFVRPGTQSGRPGTMEQAIRTPRTAQTARCSILCIGQKLHNFIFEESSSKDWFLFELRNLKVCACCVGILLKFLSHELYC